MPVPQGPTSATHAGTSYVVPCYVYAEDLASALIGPFANVAEAEAHIAFCAARGDAADACVVSANQAADLRNAGRICMELTAQQDREWQLEEEARG